MAGNKQTKNTHRKQTVAGSVGGEVTIEMFSLLADMCGERIPRELYVGSECRVAPAVQTPSIVHFQRLDARPIFHRRRQFLRHSAAAAYRRPLLINRGRGATCRMQMKNAKLTCNKRRRRRRSAQLFVSSLLLYRIVVIFILTQHRTISFIP